MTRDEVQQAARQWVGTSYKRKGRSAQSLDCLGVWVMLGRHFGIPHEDVLHYTDWPSRDHLILRMADRFLVRRPTNVLLPGLLPVFAQEPLPGHVGVLTGLHGALHVVHARTDVGKVTEDALDNLRPKLRLMALYALPGLED